MKKVLYRGAQGIVGTFPWQALVFFTMWLQLLGFSDLAAASLMAIFTLGCALGSLLGGRLGARRYSPVLTLTQP